MCLSAGVLPAAPVSAEKHPTHPGIVSADPTDHTPDVLDGHVNAFAQIGGTMVVGGAFSQVAFDGVVYPRRNLFAFNIRTGRLSETFHPNPRGEVFDLAAAPRAGAVYAVGDFLSVRGRRGTERIAKLRVSDGSVDGSFRSPGLDGAVRDIVRARGVYYLAGAFTHVGGRRRQFVVALDAQGHDTRRAIVRISGTHHGGQTQVRSMDISPDGGLMALAGNFTTVNGERRAQIALLRISDQKVTLSRWATDRFGPRCGPNFSAYLRDVAFSPASDYFVVATTGGALGGQEAGVLCDTVSRWNVVRRGGQRPAWVDYTGGDTLTAVIVDRRVVYVGGHQRWLNNSFGSNDAGPGAVERQGIAALDPANGLPFAWNPGRRRGIGVFGFALTEAGLWVGHDTARLGGEPRERIAFLPVDPAATLPAHVTARLPGQLTFLGEGTGNAVTTRWFSGEQSGPASGIPSGESWQQARGTFVVDGVVYAGWADGRLTARDYAGGAFGPVTNVSLQGAFPDLELVRAMFYDRVTHRIYYTVDDSSRLFYRYFEPQSQLVGTWRYVAPLTTNMNWERIGGMFVVGAQLYFVNQITGTLRTIGWSASSARPVGTSRALLGPSIDGTDYRSRGLVLTNTP